jgi:hypothetical protein
MQVFHAGHGDREPASFVQHIELARVKTDDLDCGTFRQTLRQLLILKRAANFGDLADVIDFPLGIFHIRSLARPVGHPWSDVENFQLNPQRPQIFADQNESAQIRASGGQYPAVGPAEDQVCGA